MINDGKKAHNTISLGQYYLPPVRKRFFSLFSFRSALVNNNVFAALAVKWNLHKYIKYNSTQLYSAVNKFVQHQKSRNDRIQVEQVCVIDAAAYFS